MSNKNGSIVFFFLLDFGRYLYIIYFYQSMEDNINTLKLKSATTIFHNLKEIKKSFIYVLFQK